MNCNEFEKAVLSEPGAESEARSTHAAECPDCARLLHQATAMDRQLSAVMAVPVPQSLRGDMPDIEALAESREAHGGDNIVTFPSGRARGAARGRWPALASLAAAVALVAVFVLRPAAIDTVDGQALAAEVFEHIDEHGEWAYMRPVSTAVDDSTFEAAFQPADVSMSRDDAPGIVSYAKNCVIDGEHVPHLVVQGKSGPVTVVILPHKKLDAPVSYTRDGLEGVLLPVGESGSIAIIGRDAASVDAVREMADSDLRFTT